MLSLTVTTIVIIDNNLWSVPLFDLINRRMRRSLCSVFHGFCWPSQTVMCIFGLAPSFPLFLSADLCMCVYVNSRWNDREVGVNEWMVKEKGQWRLRLWWNRAEFDHCVVTFVHHYNNFWLLFEVELFLIVIIK